MLQVVDCMTHLFPVTGKPTPAVITDVVSISYRSIVIAVQPGYDGGAVQTISCQYKPADSDSDGDYATADVTTLTLGNVTSFEMTVGSDLQASTRYVIRLVSDNSNDGNATYGELREVTTRGKHFRESKKSP